MEREGEERPLNYGGIIPEEAPENISVWDSPYPLGMRTYIIVNYLLDICLIVAIILMVIFFGKSTDYNEILWLCVMTGLMGIISLWKCFLAYKAGSGLLVMIKVRHRCWLLIPQLMQIAWTFMSMSLFNRKSRSCIHIITLLLLIYCYSQIFLTIVDCLLLGFLFFFLLSFNHSNQVPATEEVEQLLYKIPYNEEFLLPQDDCAICLNGYTPEDTLVYLPCNGFHHFHENCIINWLRRNSICPVCRQKISEYYLQSTPVNGEILRNHFRHLQSPQNLTLSE